MSGDMFLGALVDAGVPARLLEETVAALGVEARLQISRVLRSGISATKVDVWVGGQKDLPREQYWEKQAAVGHSHEHQHSDGAHHEHQNHEHASQKPERASRPLPHEHLVHERPAHGHAHSRGLTEIRSIIHGAAISDRAKATSVAIFEALGAAEAKIHNTSIEEIHFHEVGAVDAIVDIVCAAVGAEALEDEITCSPLNVGGGCEVRARNFSGAIPARRVIKGAPVSRRNSRRSCHADRGDRDIVLACRFRR
jgi:uncharacterized protein (DUF111 family)